MLLLFTFTTLSFQCFKRFATFLLINPHQILYLFQLVVIFIRI